MNKVGTRPTLGARSGKGQDVEQFLSLAPPLVAAEVGMTPWFAFKIGPRTFGIFDNGVSVLWHEVDALKLTPCGDANDSSDASV